MNNKKVLFVGCSFTANCGFLIENQSKYHWPYLICQQTGHQMVNKAIGGMSNHEIFLRTMDSIATESYDLVVVMWSEADRYWAYCADNNVDDYTILNRGIPSGFCCDKDFVISYARLYYSHFNNRYVNVKNWLLYCLSLQQALKQQNIAYVFIKGFENHVNGFTNADYDQGFKNINSIKPLLDFDQRPDDFILKKISSVQNLIQLQDQTRWLNLHDLSFYDMMTDVADDATHPGPATNAALAENFINFYKSLNE